MTKHNIAQHHMHFITFHFITFHFIALHYFTLQYSTDRQTDRHTHTHRHRHRHTRTQRHTHITLHCITLHCIASQHSWHTGHTLTLHTYDKCELDISQRAVVSLWRQVAQCRLRARTCSKESRCHAGAWVGEKFHSL